MSTIADNIANVRERIQRAAEIVGRDASQITLIAVSKTRPAPCIREAWAAGIVDVGENYLQEALDKQAELSDLPLNWHFIGPIQSNKTRAIAEQFDWVHSVDRLKIARRLSEQRPAERPPLNVCLQINISGEASKSGCHPDELAELARAVAALPNLQLRGLMAIPEAETDPARQRRSDPGNPDVCAVYTWYQKFMPEEAELTAQECRGAARGCVDCKKRLLAGVTEHFAPLRERRARYEDDPALLDDIVQTGCARARAAARETMGRVRDAMGIG